MRKFSITIPLVLTGFFLLLGLSGQCAVIYVKPTGNDASDGLSWARAKRTIQAGLNAARSGDEVWVASGTYFERISLKMNVALYGGFAGNETSVSQRPAFPRPYPDPYASVLDGSGLGPVVTVKNLGSGSHRIDGFVIQNGQADYGGGIYCWNSSPVISNNIITGNSAYAGGGIFCSNSYATISNNTITENLANWYGGGGIYCQSSHARILNNTIARNEASYNNGGGIYCRMSSDTVLNNTIVDNTANHGGGMYCELSTITALNNIISFNSSGIYSYSTYGQSIFLRNNCVYNPDGYNYLDTPKGIDDIEADPGLVSLNSGDYHLDSGSPCIDAGYDGVVLSSWVDMDGDARIRGPHVDIGADEWYPPPYPASISPSEAQLCTGIKYTFKTVWYNDNGYVDTRFCWLLFNTDSPDGTNTCYVLYDRVQNKLYLRDEENSTWLGGTRPRSSGVIENSYCKLYCAESSVSGSGKLLTLNLRIEFKQTFMNKTTPGSKLVAWAKITDNKGVASDWIPKGEYTWMSPVSLSPSTGKIPVGTKTTFTTVWRDDDGYTDIRSCLVLFDTSLSNGNVRLYAMYDRARNRLYLRNDAGTAWLGGYAPGSASTIENSYCKLYCAESSVSGSGKLLTLKLSIEFKQPLADKTTPGTTIKAWQAMADSDGTVSAWVESGSYTWLYPVSLSPYAGQIQAGTSYTFTTVWRDDNGYADIQSCWLQFNTSPTPGKGTTCYVLYKPSTNRLYLRNDAGTAWLGGYAPGSVNVIENSYCRLYCSASSVSGSGKLLTLKLRIEFKQALLNKIPAGGTLNAWMLIADAKGSASGWILKGGYQP